MDDLRFPDDLQDLTLEKDIIYKGPVVKITQKKRRHVVRYLFVTSLRFYLFRKRFCSKQLILSTSFSWWDIKELDAETSGILKIMYETENDLIEETAVANPETVENPEYPDGEPLDPPEPFIIKTLELAEEVVALYLSFHKYMLSFMHPREYPKFCHPPGVSISIPKKGAIEVVKHLQITLKKDGHTLLPAAKSSVIHYCTKKPREFRLNQLKMIIDYLPTFLETLEWIDTITKIIVPCKAQYGKHSLTQLLSNFLLNNENIRTLVFNDRLTDDFQDFIDAVLASSTDKVRNLEFNDCDLSQEAVEGIINWIANKRIVSLIVVNSLSPMVSGPFIRGLEKIRGMSNVEKLVLDGTPGLNVTSLMPLVRKVKHLSLVRCDAEISEIFKSISELKNSRMETIIVSNNKCSRIVEPRLVFPATLSTIVVNDVLWNTDSLLNLYLALMKHKPESEALHLEFALTKLPPGMWDREVYPRMARMKSVYLASLNWDGNPVSDAFFDFLDNCPGLKSLSMNGTFGPDDPLVQTCASFLACSTTLEKFSCCGTPRRAMGFAMTKLMCLSLRENKSLKEFNIGYNKAGPDLLARLVPILLRNGNLESCNIEENDITELESFRAFFERLTERERPLRMNWPEAEIQRMMQYGTATEAQRKETEALYKQVVAGNRSRGA